MQAAASDAVLVFSSSVSTYGDTTAETPPLAVEHPQTALDLYAESKIASERLVRESALPTVVLRIAGIAVPVLQEPPEVWPFTAEQRLEMVQRDDVVTALYKALMTPEARGKTLNVAGGPTWQTTGHQYVADLVTTSSAYPWKWRHSAARTNPAGSTGTTPGCHSNCSATRTIRTHPTLTPCGRKSPAC